jgi:hypothetical protein
MSLGRQSKCFQIFDDGVFLPGRKHCAINLAFVSDVGVAFVTVTRRQTIRFDLGVEFEIAPRIIGFILTPSVVTRAIRTTGLTKAQRTRDHRW